jgi:hypothetical protein
MKFRLLLDVYYLQEFRGQCLPEVKVDSWDGLGELIASPEGGIAYATQEPMRLTVNAASFVDTSTPEEERKVTARVVQIIPIV